MAVDHQISVSLFHRDAFSQGQNRQNFGYNAYHWGILVIAKDGQEETCDAYDATDSSEIDKVTWRMTNPNMDWFFRARMEIDLSALGDKLLGHIVIGVASGDASSADLQELFRRVSVPVKNTYPQQSCVTWVMDAILALQKNGLIPSFDTNVFKDRAIYYADQRLREKLPRNVIRYSDMQN